MRTLSTVIIALILIAATGCIETLEGTIWVEHTSGYQCSAPIFPTPQSAAQELENAGIVVIRMQEVSYITCEACSCPNGLFYQALIREADLDKAEAQGWSASP